jgi:hypothetical protein
MTSRAGCCICLVRILSGRGLLCVVSRVCWVYARRRVSLFVADRSGPARGQGAFLPNRLAPREGRAPGARVGPGMARAAGAPSVVSLEWGSVSSGGCRRPGVLRLHLGVSGSGNRAASSVWFTPSSSRTGLVIPSFSPMGWTNQVLGGVLGCM